jgi:hypothetical protein
MSRPRKEVRCGSRRLSPSQESSRFRLARRRQTGANQLVAQATAYVVDFLDLFSNVVAEER